MLLKRGHVFVLAAFLAAGCGSRTSATVQPAEMARPAAARNAGSLAIRILAARSDRQVQYTQSKAAKSVADIAQYQIELFRTGSQSAAFSTKVNKKTANSTSDAYTVQNVPTGAYNMVVSALDSNGANISKNGGGTSAVTVVDQSTANVSVAVALLDGVAANGDISDSVTVQNGTQVAPAVTVH